MTSFAVCQLPTGDLVVEVDDDPDVMRQTGIADKTAELVAQSFEKAVQSMRAAADSVRSQLSAINGEPDVTLEFGMKIGTELGAVIARSAADAHVTVKISWRAGGV